MGRVAMKSGQDRTRGQEDERKGSGPIMIAWERSLTGKAEYSTMKRLAKEDEEGETKTMKRTEHQPESWT